MSTSDPPPAGGPGADGRARGGSLRESMLPLVLSGMVLLLQLRPIHDVDVFWQIKLGELALDRGGPVPEEPFAATHVGEPLVPLAWLGQMVFALAFRLGGWWLLHALDATLWAAAFLVVGRSSRSAAGSDGAALIALGLGFVVGLPFASLRPQTFAVLGFGLLLALLRSGLPTARKLAFAVPLLVLWQNLHPSVSVAVAAAAGAAALGWVRALTRPGSPRPWADTGVAVLAAAATLATPAGARLFAVSAYNATASRELGVSEWLPLWDPANRGAALPAVAALVATVVLILRRRGRLPAEDLGRAGVLTVMMLAAYRVAPFWALAMIPVWAGLLASPAPGTASVGGRPWRFVLAAVLSVAVATALAAVARPRQFAEYLPLDGIARLRAAEVSGVVYCHPAWGGPLIGAGYPDWRVAYDGRYYVYSPTEWDAYFAAGRGDVPLAELDREYRPVAYFLRPTTEAGLIDLLRRDDGWAEIHTDTYSAVFVRRAESTRRPE